MRGITSILVWLVYFGLTALVIVVDRNRARAKAQADGSVDFMDRSITPYLLLGVFCGPMPVIVYFGVTRKSAFGWMLGVLAAIGIYVATVIVAIVLNILFATAT